MNIEISHPDKVLFPDDGVTKGELAEYYEQVAEWMLPHIKGRPLSLQRFPAGIGQRGFFHKDAPDYFPAWVRRVEAAKHGGSVTHAIASDARTLVYLANQNTITPHVWLSRADRIDRPDRLVIDLDPAPKSDFADVRRAARNAGDLLREVGLEPFAQVTGSKGIHVWTPIQRRADFDHVKEFADGLAELLAARDPDALTTEFRKAQRGGPHPGRRAAKPLRPDGRAALRGAAPGRSTGRHPDRVGGALGLEAASRQMDDPDGPAQARQEG